MEIKLVRKAKKSTYTIGKVYVNGKYFCDSLEDKDRGLKQSMSIDEIKKNKVYGKTAIPTGKYEVKSYFWTKYNCYVGWLQDVPGFSGILLHNGTNENSTEGCPLLGKNNIVGRLDGDRIYMDALAARIIDCEKIKEKVFITIE